MRKKLLCILGPTSTGKTDLALILAKKLNGQLISADSRQVYRYLDIGTGKEASMKQPSFGGKYQVSSNPPLEARGGGFWNINGINIWMYDVVEPKTRFNLYGYIVKTETIIKKIVKSGKLPILVGGTGLYIRGLLEGVSDFGISEVRNVRLELENLDLDDVRKKINLLNPEVLEKLNNSEINNKRRLIRLYEKLINPNENEITFPGIAKDFDVLKIGLKAERKILREKIRQRVISRIDQGMIEESKNLLEQGILTYERMEELGLEYKYIAKFLKGEYKSPEEFIDALSLKIGQFARRQETWFKKEKGVVWVDITQTGYVKKVEKIVIDWYNKQSLISRKLENNR